MSRRELALYLRDLGWKDVEVVSPEPRDGAAPAASLAVSGDAADPVHAPTLVEMRQLLAGCTRCRLCQARKQVVFGVGNPVARLMFIGEGPGADEDRLGEPFVGRAGQLLTSMIRALGLTRNDVYIANIVKCRPPGNRDPEVGEAAACLPFLRRQIELVDPTRYDRADLKLSWALDQLRQAGRAADVPPGLPAAHAIGEGAGLARPEGGQETPGSGIAKSRCVL
jgi:hypothetical protein